MTNDASRKDDMPDHIEHVACCARCDFFKLDEQSDMGECRKSSPVIYFESMNDDRGYMPSHEGYWPRVDDFEWCGSFKWRGTRETRYAKTDAS